MCLTIEGSLHERESLGNIDMVPLLTEKGESSSYGTDGICPKVLYTDGSYVTMFW